MILLYIWGGFLALVLLYVLVIAVCALLVDPEKEYQKDNRFYRFLLNLTVTVGLKLLLVRVHVSGIEKIPKDTQVLLISNHRSNFDPIVTWYGLKAWKIGFISKPENFRIPFYGRIIRKCCCLPIDRENPRKAIVTINKASKLLKKQEISIGVYPEGTRSKTREMLPFHNGVFKIAQKADAPIVVLSIAGTEKIAKRTPFKPTDVYLDVLEVFPSENIQGIKTETIGMMARHLIAMSIKKRDNLWQLDM